MIFFYEKNALFAKNTKNFATILMLKGKTMKKIYFAAGCFWGSQKLFSKLRGVEETYVGYANGMKNIVPTYEMVKHGNTHFKETLEVIYDENIVSLTTLLRVYFEIIDVTRDDGQAHDIGEQYRPGIYYVDNKDEEIINKIANQIKTKFPVFKVEIMALENFYLAEEYHQNYLEKNPNGYCHISNAEIAKFKYLMK
jgi:peptide methionine sulfoxide reductase msrA/msrB